jgi:nicotinamide riboside kinase
MLKIILTGPESCGKTTLARQLATHFNAPLVEEYVREFFEKKETTQYEEADLVEIARGQLSAENKVIIPLLRQLVSNESNKAEQIVICDTDVLTIKIWAEEKYGRCDDFIIQQCLISNSKFQVSDTPAERSNFKRQTIYLLCSPEGINWEADPLRENPNDRDRLFAIYEQNLIFYQKNYFILRGSIFERFELAKDILIQF